MAVAYVSTAVKISAPVRQEMFEEINPKHKLCGGGSTSPMRSRAGGWGGWRDLESTMTASGHEPKT